MTIVNIGAGQSLESGAAASFKRVLAIRPGMLARVNSSYRSLEEQAVFYHAWLVDKKVFALKPGVSKHNFGTALDIDSSPVNADHQWMVDHGAEYGWVRTNSAEPWHFEYQAWRDQHVSDTTPLTATPSHPRKKSKMLHFVVNDSASARGIKYVILMPDGRRADYTSGATDFPNAVAANIGNAIPADEALIKSLQTQLRASGPATATATATIDPAAIKAAMPTAAQIAALVPAPVDNSDSLVAKFVAAFKGLSWSVK